MSTQPSPAVQPVYKYQRMVLLWVFMENRYSMTKGHLSNCCVTSFNGAAATRAEWRSPSGTGKNEFQQNAVWSALLGPAGTKQSASGGCSGQEEPANVNLIEKCQHLQAAHIVAIVVAKGKACTWVTTCAKNSWEQTRRHGLNPTSYDKLDPHEQQETTSVCIIVGHEGWWFHQRTWVGVIRLHPWPPSALYGPWGRPCSMLLGIL